MPAPSHLHRLAIVLSHPTQYYSPWFRWLRAHTSLNFRVFYLSDHGLKPSLDAKFKTSFAWDTDLTSGYDWELVPNTAAQPDVLRYDGLRNPSLPARLKTYAPSAILVFGYNYHTHLRLIAWARFRRIPLLFRGDSHLLGRPHPRFVKRSLLSFLYRQFSAITYVGQANFDYFRHFRFPAARLFHAPHSVNSTHFQPSAETQQQAQALRQLLGLSPAQRVVLFAGKFIAQKQPLALLHAFVAARPPDAVLVFAGDGPERDALLAAAKNASASASIHFLPFANQQEMPARYAFADLLVLPSIGGYETWGLCVNEAMHMGCPCLVSDVVGCQRDLVIEGQTGWVFTANSHESFREKISLALNTLATRAPAIRQAVAEKISAYTYAQTSAGLLRALDSLPYATKS